MASVLIISLGLPLSAADADDVSSVGDDQVVIVRGFHTEVDSGFDYMDLRDAGSVEGDSEVDGMQLEALAIQPSSMSLGASFGCAIIEDRSLACWGYNGAGQLGAEFPTHSSVPIRPQLPDGLEVRYVTTGASHACAILSNGSTWCWGANSGGQTGQGFTSYSVNVPSYVHFPANESAIEIKAGYTHTCALLSNRSVSCWGEGKDGQLGDGMATDSLTPVHVNLPQGRSVEKFDSGGQYNCAILDDASVHCWGRWYYHNPYQVDLDVDGDGQSYTQSNATRPVSISTTRISSCAILDDGSVRCWGSDMYGLLGDGGSNNGGGSIFQAVGVQLPEERRATSIDMGQLHACVSLDNGSAMCWGINGQGELGTGSDYPGSYSSPTYVNFSRMDGYVASMSTGLRHTCAAFSDNAVSCWGFGGFPPPGGALGDGIGGGSFQPSTTVQFPSNQTLWSSDPEFVSAKWHGTPDSVTTTPQELNLWVNHSSSSVRSTRMVDVVPSIGLPSGSEIALRTGEAVGAGLTRQNCDWCTYEIEPTLPRGLVFNTSNADISGTPTELSTERSYTIVATARNGSDSVAFRLRIDGHPPQLLPLLDSSLQFVEGARIVPVEFQSTGGRIDSWSVLPDLPFGLSLNQLTGRISGVAVPADYGEVYTIWANNSFGSSSTTFSLVVLPDNDGDLIVDYLDDDDDNDGVRDSLDAFPLNSCYSTDDDSDGNPDFVNPGCVSIDADDDQDGINDWFDAFPNDWCAHSDYDGDGLPDDFIVVECDTALTEDTDDDNDGVVDLLDAFPYDETENADTDADGIGDNRDGDVDGDGYPNTIDDFPMDPTEWVDTDLDGIGNNLDFDDDGDGVNDGEDEYPLDPSRWTTDTIPPDDAVPDEGPNGNPLQLLAVIIALLLVSNIVYLMILFRKR